MLHFGIRQKRPGQYAHGHSGRATGSGWRAEGRLVAREARLCSTLNPQP